MGGRGARSGRGGPAASSGGPSGGPPGGGSGGSGGSPGAPGDRLVFGAGPIRELILRRPAAVRAVWVDPHRAGRTTSDPVAAIVTAARAAQIRVEDRDRAALDRAAGEGALHQGVIAWLGAFTYADLDDLVSGAVSGASSDSGSGAAGEPALIVALDGVEDPRNLGAILRSAYLLGAAGVIIPEHRAAGVTPAVAKASAGASELLPIAQVPNLVRALEQLRELGLWRVAVHDAPGAQSIDTIDGTLPLCLVLGAEGTGVRPLVAKSCDFHAVIPMARAAVGSFNVSVAASLALYEVRRQRDRRRGDAPGGR